MNLKEELGIPAAATFVETSEGICIGDVFGGTWCAETYDEENDRYFPTPEVYGAVSPEPETAEVLCRGCRLTAEAEDV